jgi:hypothetical protein
MMGVGITLNYLVLDLLGEGMGLTETMFGFEKHADEGRWFLRADVRAEFVLVGSLRGLGWFLRVFWGVLV